LCGVLELSYPALSSKRCHFYAKRSSVVNWQLDNTTPPTTICTVWKKGLGTIGGARPSGAAATVKERVIIKLNMGPKHAKTLVSIHVSNGRRKCATLVNTQRLRSIPARLSTPKPPLRLRPPTSVPPRNPSLPSSVASKNGDDGLPSSSCRPLPHPSFLACRPRRSKYGDKRTGKSHAYVNQVPYT
jgi:hypothetical protein